MTCLQAVCQAMSSLWLSHFEICPSGLFLSPSFSLLHSVWVLIRDTKSCPHCPSAGHTLPTQAGVEPGLVPAVPLGRAQAWLHWSCQRAAGWSQTTAELHIHQGEWKQSLSNKHAASQVHAQHAYTTSLPTDIKKALNSEIHCSVHGKDECYMDISTRKRAFLLGRLNYCANITHFTLHRSLLPVFSFSFQMMPSMAHSWDASGTLCWAPTVPEQYPAFGHMCTEFHCATSLPLLWP